MKKLSLLLFFLSIYSYSQTIYNSLNIDIRGKDCNGGLSFCTIETNPNSKQISNKYSLQKITENELLFVINIKELTIDEQKNIFGKEIQYISESDTFFFRQDYNFQLKIETCKLLEINPQNSIILKESYPIKIIENKAIIILKLTNKI
ncbi:hypothetical protein [Flavobacterium urocaniciphilum]|uniref:Uncharacterized protein n=1 Tax=Flavobacterium urocaniciphilum TaxID=1299341 RepID=A0A1H9DJR6_9FLAO|nr:hypothetical protein [Flavobacterium urocaniciphilum]SEQ13740.1 hypothetical protein SAMN05444005_10785 [Flavobacterium urocaniciphilum]